MEQVIEISQESAETEQQQQVVELSLELLGQVGGGGTQGTTL